MNPTHLVIPTPQPVRSLCWLGDALVDWVDGCRTFGLDGKMTESRCGYAYRFDAAVQSDTGRFAAIYERLGTKALVLDGGKPIRELNRSCYHADVYEYPIVIFDDAQGRTLIAHCPESYDRIEIEDALTGESLTACADRKPVDLFHSRLSVSPSRGRLLSAGWFWHPADVVTTWSIREAIENPRVLDMPGPPEGSMPCPVSSAAFIDENRLLLAANPGEEAFDPDDASAFKPGSLGVFNILTEEFESVAPIDEPAGTLMSLGEGLAIGFHKHPKVFEVATGRIVHRWPGLASGNQASSIIRDFDRVPSLAMHPTGRRFAIAAADHIDVVSL